MFYRSFHSASFLFVDSTVCEYIVQEVRTILTPFYYQRTYGHKEIQLENIVLELKYVIRVLSLLTCSLADDPAHATQGMSDALKQTVTS